MAVRSRIAGLSGREDLVDLIDKVPLVGRAEAEGLVEDLEETVGDAAREKVLPLVAGAAGIGALALVLAIKNRRG